MITSDITLADIQNFKGKFPKQLWYLFFSEMWERFCFYGMRGMLTYFMINQLFLKETEANLQYGATQAFVYAFTFIGGLFADKILGFRKSLFWGGILMIVGSVILAINPQEYFFWGISFTIIGTGFFKPNISTMVGSLYKQDDSRRDAGFSLFYAGINTGALMGGYLCIWLGKNHSWNLAFGVAGIVMAISLLTFLATQRSLGPIGLAPRAVEHIDEHGNLTVATHKPWHNYAVFAGTLAIIPIIRIMVAKTDYTDYFMYSIGPIALIYLFYEMSKCDKAAQRKLFAALIFIFFSVFFWAFFEQSGGSLSIFAAKNLDDKLLGSITLDPNGVNNSANSLFVIIFAPILGIIWIAMAKRKIEPNTVVKFGLGFLFLAGAFYIFYATRFGASAQGIASLDIFTLAYFVITIGELCLSPIGLSIMTKLSPAKLQGVMMGMWFLCTAYGQYVAGLLGANLSKAGENDSPLQKLITYTDGYLQLGIYALIAGVLLIAISPLVRKLMGEVK